MRDKLAKARQDLELAQELNKCMATDSEKRMEVGQKIVSENPEIERLRGMLKAKKELIEKLRAENEQI